MPRVAPGNLVGFKNCQAHQSIHVAFDVQCSLAPSRPALAYPKLLRHDSVPQQISTAEKPKVHSQLPSVASSPGRLDLWA